MKWLGMIKIHSYFYLVKENKNKQGYTCTSQTKIFLVVMQALLGDVTGPYRLCDSRNRLVSRRKLLRESKIKNGSYLFIVNERDEIIYYPNVHNVFKVCDGQGASPEVLAIRKPINHTNLAGNRPVKCAGEFVCLDHNILLNNQSGHYMPPENTLDIPKKIMERLGYTVVLQPYEPEFMDLDDVDFSGDFSGDSDFDKPRDYGFGGTKKRRNKRRRKTRR